MSAANGRPGSGPMARAMAQLGAAMDEVRGALAENGESPPGSGVPPPDSSHDAAAPHRAGPLASLNARVESLQQGLDAARAENARRARLTLRLTIIQWTVFITLMLLTNWYMIGPAIEDAWARAVHGWGIQRFVEVEQQYERSTAATKQAEAEVLRLRKELDANPDDPSLQDAMANAIIRLRDTRREADDARRTLEEYRKRYRKP